MKWNIYTITTFLLETKKNGYVFPILFEMLHVRWNAHVYIYFFLTNMKSQRRTLMLGEWMCGNVCSWWCLMWCWWRSSSSWLAIIIISSEASFLVMMGLLTERSIFPVSWWLSSGNFFFLGDFFFNVSDGLRY